MSVIAPPAFLRGAIADARRGGRLLVASSCAASAQLAHLDGHRRLVRRTGPVCSTGPPPSISENRRAWDWPPRPVAMLLVLGWQGWMRGAWPWVHGTVVALFVRAGRVAPARAHRPTGSRRSRSADAAPAHPLDATTATVTEVVVVDFPAGFDAGRRRLAARALDSGRDHVITEDLTLFLHLSDAADTLLYHFDGVPAGGTHPTRQWQPGAAFADDYAVRLATPVMQADPGPLSAGFYPFEQRNSRVTLTDAAGNPVGDRLVLGHVRLLPAPPLLADADAVPLASWSGGIDLLASPSSRVARSAATCSSPGALRPANPRLDRLCAVVGWGKHRALAGGPPAPGGHGAHLSLAGGRGDHRSLQRAPGRPGHAPHRQPV
ncbi:MAG: hypothetical protein R3A10_18930 [Caldilineaceae bacterium]